MEIRSCSISQEPREAGGQIQGTGSKGLILFGYEQMQAAVLPRCFLPSAPSKCILFSPVGTPCSQMQKTPGALAGRCTETLVQASQGCFHHLQARLV